MKLFFKSIEISQS